MFLRPIRRVAVVAVVCGVSSCSTLVQASVGSVLGYPFRWLGGQVFGGGVDKLKGAADTTIAQLDTRLTTHELRLEGMAEHLLDDAKGKLDDSVLRVDHSLELRLLQIKTGADDSVDRALSRVDSTLRDRLVQLHGVGQDLISDAGSELRQSIDRADQLLRERTADIDAMGRAWISQVDQALEDRISQLDEAAGRRLGNIDVIATKQRLGLEKSALQVLSLGAIIVFVVAVLKRLFKAHEELEAELRHTRGAARSALLARRFGRQLVGPLLAVCAGIGVLYGLYRWLPLGAVREAEQLTALHLKEIEESAARLDYAGARFHASHIQFLKPEVAARAMAEAEKVGLLRDLADRPTLLATRDAVGAFEARVRAIEPLLGPRPDPDVLVMRAIVLWETGETRVQEHVAASLAARALRLAPRGFALAPLARAYVAAFLDAPYLEQVGRLGRDEASLEELREALDAAAPDAAGSPFAPAAELARLMQQLEHSSGEHYLALVKAHAAAVALVKAHGVRDPQLPALLSARTEQARALVADWSAFDDSLAGSPLLAGPSLSPRLLNVFHLNDAVLTRARWFLEQPATLKGAPRLEELSSTPNNLALRLKLAPARVAWARRYKALLAGPLRPIVEFEEAERYRSWERWSIEFEQASVAAAQAANGGDAPARWRLAMAASALALYTESPDGARVAYARQVGVGLSGSVPPALVANVPDLPQTLEQALLQRGPKLL
jgi:hypothetical protein